MAYWERKNSQPRQLSFRSGDVECELIEDRVLIGGKTARYLEGEILIQ